MTEPQEISGSQVWIEHHCFHRLNGPAVIHADDSVEWWVEGRFISDEWRPLGPLTPTERSLVLMLWAPDDDLYALVIALLH